MFIRIKEDGEIKSEAGIKFKAKTIWAYKKTQAAFNYILNLKCFVPKCLLTNSIIPLPNMTEIIPCPIKYEAYNDMLCPLPGKAENVYRNNHRTKQNMLRAKDRHNVLWQMDKRRVYYWLRCWEKLRGTERHSCWALLAVDYAKMVAVRRYILSNSATTEYAC